jgi:hypothetical protein
MKYTDIIAERHDILEKILKLKRQLKELDRPIVEQLATAEPYCHYHNPIESAANEVRKMHLKHDPAHLKNLLK